MKTADMIRLIAIGCTFTLQANAEVRNLTQSIAARAYKDSAKFKRRLMKGKHDQNAAYASLHGQLLLARARLKTEDNARVRLLPPLLWKGDAIVHSTHEEPETSWKVPIGVWYGASEQNGDWIDVGRVVVACKTSYGFVGARMRVWRTYCRVTDAEITLTE